MTPVRPSLRLEKSLLAAGRVTVIGVDEVGRGAIAGPVAVGAAAVTIDVRRVPQGLADSKLLSQARREALVPVVTRWARTAVGMASAQVVDEQGIVAALGLAGSRAIGTLVQDGVSLDGAVVVLDGSFDWLTRALPAEHRPLDVQVRVKADRDCASVAAASVVAKVARDDLMIAAHDEAPHYAWASNKGYGSTAHYDAIRAVGPHELHRKTWLHAATSVALDGFAELDAVDG
ncbi:ribonuclease HII [Curtobacterium herbarum]|uniref:Ribonuclease n=1 Tax=Curtobacterium herbarum TaxID=150122 RepID=A0ABN1Z9T2_9MICO|nr:ribonuclease HII [Curtobacterium herbarum]MBM7475114.1 ribonuclease HII [Curtobacterium herbarum]MCS6543032.1 ribonuclease HII [Curtobacterium herbarum]